MFVVVSRFRVYVILSRSSSSNLKYARRVVEIVRLSFLLLNMNPSKLSNIRSNFKQVVFNYSISFFFFFYDLLTETSFNLIAGEIKLVSSFKIRY